MDIIHRKGLYREATTLMYYYQMRSPENNINKLCYAQFCKEYDPYRKRSKNKTYKDDDSDDSEGGNRTMMVTTRKEGSWVMMVTTQKEVNQMTLTEDQLLKIVIEFISNNDSVYRLPNIIKLKNTKPGDANFLIEGKCPVLSDFSKHGQRQS